MRAYAIRFQQTGGPEVLSYQEVEVGDPGQGEVLLRQAAIGVNFIDTYYRSGLYPLPLPSGLGQEGCGVVEKIGKGVIGLKMGDRVAYASAPTGSYATWRLMPAARVVKIPKEIDDRTAAKMMLQGMTAEYLLHRTYKVKKGDTILVHAAAGGMGLILCQWAKALGATVIGTASTDEKAALAKKHGCKFPIVYSREDFVARVKEITKGKGVPVVYDGVGKDTWPKSLDCLMPRGFMVSFGSASGPLPPISSAELSSRGSLFFTRPTMGHYTATRADLELSAGRVISAVKNGKVKIRINQTYPLRDAAQAHRDLQARKTTGSILLLP
jgi:NADPH:quinone reductase-like Zn-dependent oxidoreductase